MSLDINKIKKNQLGFFRFKELNNKILLTNEVGEYLFLKKEDFAKFISGELDKKSEVYKDLVNKDFVKKEIDEEKAAEKYARRKSFLFQGPSLHIFVLTKRCDNKCVYCHASAENADKEEFDMSKDTALKALNVTFGSPSKNLAIEFQGGEPLLNWNTLKYIVEEAHKINKRKKKNLEIRLVSNFNLMTEEKFQFLFKNGISFCTSLDGPEKLHNMNRPRVSGGVNNYKEVARWINRINKKFKNISNTKQDKVYAIPTISKLSLDHPEEIIDEYVKNGLDTLFLKPLNPYGFSKNLWKDIGYSAKDYLKFYKRSIKYIKKLNKKGVDIKEKTYEDFKQKIEKFTDPNMLESRNPCGAGIGQIAYNYNGSIYTCDEGRMLAEMGDESFKLGAVDNKYQDLIDNSVTKTMCSASCLEGLPGCEACAYLPYCGTCPLYNYSEHGNIFAQMPNNERCRINMAILDEIFREKYK